MNFANVIYRIGDDFSITAVRLSHRDYTDEREKERERQIEGERDAVFNRKRSRENNSLGFARRSVCLRKLPGGLNGKCVSMLCREIDRRPFCSE